MRSFLCINIAMEKNKPKSKEEKTQPKLKEYFTVKVEAVAPIILSYKILAESPEEAAIMAVKLQGQQQNSPPVISFGRLGKLKTKVYKSGTTMLQLVKNF